MITVGVYTPTVCIAIFATIVVALFIHYHIRGAFLGGLIVGSLLGWTIEGNWPNHLIMVPPIEHGLISYDDINFQFVSLLCSLVFMQILILNGMSKTLSDLAKVTKSNGSIPRGNWVFVICGLANILSGYCSGPPILISPECVAGIRAGAKTGFSTIVCGLLFAVASFFGPLFASVPECATSPLLFIVGMNLFQNVGRIDWTNELFAVPAFFTLLLIPLTYSIVSGGEQNFDSLHVCRKSRYESA